MSSHVPRFKSFLGSFVSFCIGHIGTSGIRVKPAVKSTPVLCNYCYVNRVFTNRMPRWTLKSYIGNK